MKPYQTSKRNHIEDILFPMEVCNVTQADNEGTHAGTYACDLAGGDSGQDTAYFPFSAVSKALDTPANGNAVFWESLAPVRFADGTIDYCTLMVLHDNDPSGFAPGASYPQGHQMAVEGTAGKATGNHLHMEFAKGKFTKCYDRNAQGVYHLPNNMPIEDACFIDDTRVLGYARSWNWRHLSDVPASSSAGGSKTLVLGANADTWRVYPTDRSPVVGNECGFLYPSKFGGLEYEVLDEPMAHVVTIRTRDYGIVNIYAGPETGAVIR